MNSIYLQQFNCVRIKVTRGFVVLFKFFIVGFFCKSGLYFDPLPLRQSKDDSKVNTFPRTYIPKRVTITLIIICARTLRVHFNAYVSLKEPFYALYLHYFYVYIKLHGILCFEWLIPLAQQTQQHLKVCRYIIKTRVFFSAH